MNNKTLKFKCNPEGLYTYKVSDEYLKKQSHLINMVKENRDTPKGNLNKPREQESSIIL
jgi:hypothetical protein